MNRTQITIGIIVLLIGVTVYVCDRPPDQIYFLNKAGVSSSVLPSASARFGVLGNWLPSFVHTLAFILITAGIIAKTRKRYLAICLCWLIVDWVLELGQRYDSLATRLTPGWLTGIPFFENTANYFRQGTFDWWDMAFNLAGAIAGYFILVLSQTRGQNTETPIR